MILKVFSELSLTSVILLIVSFLILVFYLSKSRNKLPPGPTPFPVIGNIHLIFGRDQRVVFEELRRKYGDIFTFYLGHKPIIVVCGYNLIKEVFHTMGGAFTGRPPSFIMELAGNKGILATSGRIWKEQRRFTLSTLRDFGMGKNILQDKILEEADKLEQELLRIASSDHPANLQDLTYISVSNIINSMVFGKRFEYDDEEFLVLTRALVQNFRTATSVGVLDIFPFLRHVPGDPFKAKQMLSNAQLVTEAIRKLVKAHFSDYDENDVRDFVDAYIKEMKLRENDHDTTFDEDQMVHVAIDMFVAGTETTSTTMMWVWLYFMNYPDVQNRVWEEISDNIGTERRPTMADRQSLPFLEATLMEVLRHCDLVPINAPHCPLEDATIDSFTIPKGTSVTAFMHSVSYGEDVWGDPRTFRPTRFLDENGRFFRPEHALFFFLGKRVCVGESLAKMNLFLSVASIVQRFEILPPNGIIPPLKGTFGFIHSPQPYEVKLKLRE